MKRDITAKGYSDLDLSIVGEDKLDQAIIH